MYRLTKVGMNKGHTSRVYVGETTQSEVLRVRRGNDFIPIDNLFQVEEGDEVLVMRGLTSFIKTSPIKEIIMRNGTYMKFNTQTSTYELNVTEEGGIDVV